jgi:N-acetylglucosamine repressor
LQNVPIGSYLESRFQVPVQLDNDVRAMAIGESWLGNARDVSHFLCINVGYGIGAAIVLGKELYHGVSHSAGEIGHTTVDEAGPRCSCGNTGCLQVMAAGPAIAERARQAIRHGRDSRIYENAEGDLDAITALTVYQAAEEGDSLALQLLEDTGHYLGIAIANLINILNPEKVIIGGGVAKAGDFVFRPLKETVAQRSLALPYSKTQIVESALGDNATAIGAACMILKAMFSPQKSTFI